MAIPIRQTMEGMGYNVGWNPTTKGITLTSPYGQTNELAADQYSMQGDRAYMDPSLMQSYLLNPDYYKPKEITQQEVTRNYDLSKQLYQPMTDAYTQAFNKQLAALNLQSEGQQGLVQAAYGEAQNDLQSQESAERRTTSHNVAGRNISNSPLAAYEKRKISEGYADQYEGLESNRAAQIANIANNALAAAENLAAQGLTQQAQYAAKIGEAAYGMLQQEMNGPATWATNSLGALSNMANQQNTQAQQQLNQDKFSFEKQQYETEWPYKQAQYEYALNKPYYAPSSGGSGSTAKATSLYDQAKSAAYNDPRLYTGKEGAPDGSWALEDLISAYMKTYGGQQAQPAAGGYGTPQELLQYLK